MRNEKLNTTILQEIFFLTFSWSNNYNFNLNGIFAKLATQQIPNNNYSKHKKTTENSNIAAEWSSNINSFIYRKVCVQEGV